MSCCGDSSSNSKGYNNRVVGPPIGGGSNGVRDEPTPTEKLALPPSGNGSMQPEMKTVSDSVPADTGGLAVGIDFGTTFSGVSFASLKHFGDDTRMVLSWPGTAEHFRKIPTCIIYRPATPHDQDEYGNAVVPGTYIVDSWGIVAKRTTPAPGHYKCEWFKLYLTPDGQNASNPQIVLPPGITAQSVIISFLKELWKHASRIITEQTGSVSDLAGATVVLTVPSAWTVAGCHVMRDAAIQVGMVRRNGIADNNWSERLHIITEPEAAAVHAAATIEHPVLQPPKNFILCDAGGGTIDTASYRIVGSGRPVELAELSIRSGGNCGSLFIDVAFEKYLRDRLRQHPVHLDAGSMRSFMHDFADVDKLAYEGSPEQDKGSFRYDVFNLEDDHDPSIGLEMGTLVIPGKILKEEVFAPTIAQVLQVIREQLDKNPGARTDAIILVGGFANSGFLFDMVKTTFADRVSTFLRPPDCDVATVQGAARYGLELLRGKLSVMNCIAPKSYMMQVKMPATEEDFRTRPGYISINNGGKQVCDKRLMYLASKGALLKKGQRLESEFCKFASSAQDSRFTAILLVSDEDVNHRYTDQAASRELCRWTVDLREYPAFKRHFASGRGPGYIDFMLGLEFDSAEVRGTLLSPGSVLQPSQVCGVATFEYL